MLAANSVRQRRVQLRSPSRATASTNSAFVRCAWRWVVEGSTHAAHVDGGIGLGTLSHGAVGEEDHEGFSRDFRHMLHGMLLLYGAVMHIACPPRFRRLCVLAAVTCATTCLPATLLVACGAEHRTADAPNLPRRTSATPAAAGAPPDASVAAGSAAIAAAMRGSHRTPGAADRDQYRHPVETLAFFGFTPTMTVLDVGPGGEGRGLATTRSSSRPVLAKDGLYLATNREPPSTAPEPSTDHWTAYEGVRFDELLRASPELYGKVQVVPGRLRGAEAEPRRQGRPGSPDARGPHDEELGDARRLASRDPSSPQAERRPRRRGAPRRAGHGPGEVRCTTGYLPEAWVIAKVEAAGFKLAGNRRSTPTRGTRRTIRMALWSLPPSFYAGPLFSPHPAGAADRAKYAAIGESDRMTLKFVKVTP